MALPIIPKKQFDVKNKFIPKGKVVMVPFGVGQEQYVLQVKDSEDEQEKINAIKQIIEECLITKDIEVENLPLFVIEEIFLRLKQNSAGEFQALNFKCTAPVTTDYGHSQEECGNMIKLDLDLREFKLKEEEGHSKKVLFADPIGIQFKYPSISDNDKFPIKTELDLIISCIDMIFDADSVYPASDHTREELVEFWNQLSLPQKKDVYDKFFNTMPHMHYKSELKCKKCGHVHPIEFNSMLEVFT